MFNGIKNFVKNKIVNSKKFVAGANLVALMAFASPAGLCAEEDSKAVTNPADYFAMCVERDIKPNAQLYKFNKNTQYQRKLLETNYDLWWKLYRQEKAVYDKCKEETLEFSAKRYKKNPKFVEADVEQRGYMCDDLGCDICVSVQCMLDGGMNCTKKCEEVLRQNIPDELTLLDNFEKTKSYFVRSIQKTNSL